MEPRHFAAYEDSVFRHYVHFSTPGVDLPTFEYILSQWDEKRKKFVFTNRNAGEEIACSFNFECVMEHTWFCNEGLLVDHNWDRKNRIWSRLFNKPEAEGASSIAPPKEGPTRRNVEQLFLKLVHSADRRDVKDFVLLQILYQLSMIRCPSSVSDVPRYLYKYVDNIEQVMPQDIDEDVEQPNEAVEKMEWPQQVIYWKSIASMNQALRCNNKNKFKDMIAVDRVKISSLSVKVAKESPSTTIFSDINKESEDAPPGEVPPPEDYRIDTTFEAEINEGENVSKPAKELLTCTGTQREDTGKEITLVDDVPSVGHDTETQTCIDTPREDTGREIKQSEDAPPPAPDTSTENEDAPIRFSRNLNKRKRGTKGTRTKVSAAAPLRGNRCRRVVKPSKWVVIPYTKGKKKKEKDNIGDKAIVEVSGEEEEQV
ncbi:uncharacterized protein A4U43_C10F9690 [Asparagus officinalis]|uniref:Uncharacterized protein n=1 Tax=Asparagus officinalis TaxID=4686 RepID=A0A5P1E1R2_ASPOF|nr:uncharacterized protein A4U43_C10F9690 [Asparagus officinalis]